MEVRGDSMSSSGSFNTSGYDGRYLKFEWKIDSQSIANNTSTISWTLKGAGTGGSSWYNAGNFKVVINGSTVYSSSTRIKLYNGTLVASGTKVITHNSNGTQTLTASAEAGIYYVAVNCTGKGSWALNQIIRSATITKAPNFTDIQNPTITYSNPAGGNVSSLQACISLTGSSADVPYRDIPKTGTSYTFNLTEAERNVLRKATPNSNTLQVRFYVKTIINGTTYHSYLTSTMTIVNANPTFSVAYLDTNTTTTNITENNQQIIQNYSTLQINVSNATALKYATLKTVSVNVNGNVETQNIGSGSFTFNIGTVNSSTNLSVPVVLKDSRDNTTTITLNVQILSYSLPSAIITLERVSNFYTETNLTVNGQYSSLNNKNQLTVQYQIKKTSDSTYGNLTTINNNEEVQFNADNQYSWNVKVILTDLLGTYSYILFLYKGIPLMYWDRVLSSIGVNCFPEDEYSFEVNGIKLFYANGDTISDSASSGYLISLGGFLTNSSKTLWFTIPLDKPTSCSNADVTMSIAVRQNGNYIVGSASSNTSYSLTNCKITPAGILCQVTNSSALSNSTNNDSVAVAIASYSITFNT